MRWPAVLLISLVGAVTGSAAQTPSPSWEGFDQSGKGAVLCTWGILVSVRNAIDLCTPGEFQVLRADLSEAIEATNAFIIANSTTPVTRADLEARMENAAKLDRTMKEAGHCPMMRKDWIEKMAAGSHEGFRRWLADFLSVPRKPVMNPCL